MWAHRRLAAGGGRGGLERLDGAREPPVHRRGGRRGRGRRRRPWGGEEGLRKRIATIGNFGNDKMK